MTTRPWISLFPKNVSAKRDARPVENGRRNQPQNGVGYATDGCVPNVCGYVHAYVLHCMDAWPHVDQTSRQYNGEQSPSETIENRPIPSYLLSQIGSMFHTEQTNGCCVW